MQRRFAATTKRIPPVGRAPRSAPPRSRWTRWRDFRGLETSIASKRRSGRGVLRCPTPRCGGCCSSRRSVGSRRSAAEGTEAGSLRPPPRSVLPSGDSAKFQPDCKIVVETEPRGRVDFPEPPGKGLASSGRREPGGRSPRGCDPAFPDSTGAGQPGISSRVETPERAAPPRRPLPIRRADP